MADEQSTIDERAEGGELGGLDETLDGHDYPATTDELIEAYGDREVQSSSGTKSVEDVLSTTDAETYDSAEEVRTRILGLLHRE